MDRIRISSNEPFINIFKMALSHMFACTRNVHMLNVDTKKDYYLEIIHADTFETMLIS